MDSQFKGFDLSSRSNATAENIMGSCRLWNRLVKSAGSGPHFRGHFGCLHRLRLPGIAPETAAPAKIGLDYSLWSETHQCHAICGCNFFNIFGLLTPVALLVGVLWSPRARCRFSSTSLPVKANSTQTGWTPGIDPLSMGLSLRFRKITPFTSDSPTRLPSFSDAVHAQRSLIEQRSKLREVHNPSRSNKLS